MAPYRASQCDNSAALPTDGLYLEEFTGFHGGSLVLLVAAGAAIVVWVALLAWRWFATFPYLPDADPPTSDLGNEPPAVVNFLVHRWKVTRAAMAATLLDLAARRLLAVEEYGEQVVVRAYEERFRGQTFNRFEQQLLDHVESQVRGRSAPVEALELGDARESFWQSFRKSVEGEAKARGLARARWTMGDRAILGVALAVALGLLALSFGAANLGRNGNGDDIGWTDWLIGAGVAWIFVNGYIFTRRALRDTAAGRAACSHWLGVRQYLRDAGNFGDLPAAAVTTWEGYLAYGTALGVAHRAAEELPFDIEDPDSAWSRYGGDWHELRVEYPRHFGATQKPLSVFFTGLWQTALFGALSFVALPLVARVAWDVGHDILEDPSLGGGADQKITYFVVGFVVAFAVAGLILLVRLLIGLAWLVRGLLDLGRAETLEGEIVKMHEGRVAIDDGGREEVVAWVPPTTAPPLKRGMMVRITKTKHLHYVSSVQVLRAEANLGSDAQKTTEEDAQPSQGTAASGSV